MDVPHFPLVINGKAQNLSEEEATRRLRGGIIMLMIGLIGAAALESVGAAPWTRAALFLPFFVAEYAFFQAIYKTCGIEAMRGFRSTGEGRERIADPEERCACRQAGRAQITHSLFSASFLTGLFFWFA